jgi:hypothetical protein
MTKNKYIQQELHVFNLNVIILGYRCERDVVVVKNERHIHSQASVLIHNDMQKNVCRPRKDGETNSHDFLYHVTTAFVNVGDHSYLSYHQSSRTFLNWIIIFWNFLSLEPVKEGDMCG